MNIQAQRLVDHLVSSGVGWGVIYREAVTKAFLAEHDTIQERWYRAIVSEIEWRGKFFLVLLLSPPCCLNVLSFSFRRPFF